MECVRRPGFDATSLGGVRVNAVVIKIAWAASVVLSVKGKKKAFTCRCSHGHCACGVCVYRGTAFLEGLGFEGVLCQIPAFRYVVCCGEESVGSA